MLSLNWLVRNFDCLCGHKFNTVQLKLIDLCKEAKINRSTFYAHYDDINDLVITIEGNFANSISHIFNFGLRQTHEAFIEMFKFIKENKFFYKA